ncbi:MAG: glycosyltransferase, partial [Gemmatimonas sp.]
MHVCLMGPVPPPWGGVQAHMMDVRRAVLSAGHRCSLINITRHRDRDADDIYFPDSASAVLGTIRALRPDVVHIHAGGDFSLRYAALFVALALGLRQSTAFTFHSGGFPDSPTGRRARPLSLRGLALGRLDAVIGVNASLIAAFRRYGVKESRLHLIP